LVMAGFMAAAPSALETARDQQDRAALEKMGAEYSPGAAKAPSSADAQYRLALAASYLAEVSIEQHDRKQGRLAAEQGIKAAEKAISLKPEVAEYYRVLATLCGQAVTDVLSGLSYGPRARDAVDRAVEKAPKSSSVYVARGGAPGLRQIARAESQPHLGQGAVGQDAGQMKVLAIAALALLTFFQFPGHTWLQQDT